MAIFLFETLSEKTILNMREAYGEMSMFYSGAHYLQGVAYPRLMKVANGRPSPPVADPEQPAQCWRYHKPEDLIEHFGEETVRQMLHSKFPSKELHDRFARIGKELRERHTVCTAELIALREKFYPGFDIADWRDGPEQYTTGVESCLLKHFGLHRFMTPQQLQQILSNYRQKLTYLWDAGGRLSPPEKKELVSRLLFFEFWLEQFGCDDAPQIPEHGGLRKARDYFRALSQYLKDHPINMEAAETLPKICAPLPPLPEPEKNRQCEDEDRAKRAWEFSRQNPKATARDFAAHLECSTSTVHELPAWKQHNANKRKTRESNPQAVSFNPGIHFTGKKDSVLDKLIQEQEADKEPSPLDFDPEKKPPKQFRKP